MKYKNKIYLLVAFLVFSACEIKWDMNVVFNEDFSGKYSIKLLINEELQLYALDIGEESSIGSLMILLQISQMDLVQVYSRKMPILEYWCVMILIILVN